MNSSKPRAILILILLASSLVWFYPSCKASTIVDEDFENWNVNSWLIYSDGSQIVYADIGRGGSYGLFVEESCSYPGNNKEFIYRYPTAMNELSLTFYVNFHWIVLTGISPIEEFIYVEDGGASLAQYMVGIKLVDGLTYFVAYSGGTNTYYPLYEISYAHWYKIKLVIFRNATNGYDRLWIDNVLLVDNSGIDTELPGGGGMNGFYLGMVGGDVDEWWFDIDDIKIYDSTSGGSELLNIYAESGSNGENITMPFTINRTWYSTPYSCAMDPGIYDVAFPTMWNLNGSHTWNFINWTDSNGGYSYSERIINFTEEATYIVYYSLNRNWDPGGWVNFILGLIGFGLMFFSWIFGYGLWKDDEYAKAIGVWLGMFTIGLGIFTVMLGG